MTRRPEQPPAINSENPNPSLYSLWPDNYIPMEIFPQRVEQALDELMGARYFVTQMKLVDGDFYVWQTRTHLLASMRTAIDKQRQLVQADPDNSHLQEQFHRLTLEHEGMSRVVNLVRNSKGRSTVVWLSPPGLGLDSNETRVNLFWRQGDDVVNSISLVASPEKQFSLSLFYGLGKKLPDDAAPSTSSFLATPVLSQQNRSRIIGLVNQLNSFFRFNHPGLGVNLEQLTRFVESKKNNLTAAELDFLASAGFNLEWLNNLRQLSLNNLIQSISKSNYKSEWSESVKLLIDLFHQIIKPWQFLYSKNRFDLNVHEYDKMIAFLLMNGTGCGGLFEIRSETKALGNLVNPFGLLSKNLFDLLGIKIKIKGCLDK